MDIDDSQPGAIVIALRSQLTEDLPALGPDDIADWGTVLATRTTESALVNAHRRLREVRTSSISLAGEADDSQIHELLALVVFDMDSATITIEYRPFLVRLERPSASLRFWRVVVRQGLETRRARADDVIIIRL